MTTPTTTFRTSQFHAALETALKETGLQLQKSAHEVAVYATMRSADLAKALGQKGFDEAVVAARDAVALYAGIRAVENADAADNRVLGLIHGALAMAITAI